MWAICKKELRQFFSTLTGYIAIIVFLLVNGFVLFVFKDNILEFGYATLDAYFEFAPWVLMFLVSAVTMRSFSDEFKGGTFELLQTRPLGTWQIVTGKFFGSLIVAIIALLPTLVYYFTINHLASTEGIDAGAAAGSYLGLFLLTAVFTAIGICVSSFTTNSVVAFIVSLIACMLFYYGFTAISQLAGFQSGADYYIEMIGIDFHYQSISRGVVDTRDVVYFLGLVLFFLWVTRQNLGERTRKPNFFKWGALVVGLFVVNFVASRMHARFDLTEEKRYSLTSTSYELLRKLEKPLTIDVFLEGDFPSQFRKLANTTREFLVLFKDVNPSKIRYRFIDPLEEATAGITWADSLKSLGASPINITVQVKAGEENKIAFPYAVVRYDDYVDLVNLFPNSKRNITVAELNNAEAMMEYQFAKSIDQMVDPKRPTVLYNIGNGEPQGPETYDMVQTISSQYDFRIVNLHTQPYIPGPDTIDVLMIVKPDSSFTDAERVKIDQFVMRGGKVLWALDNLYSEPDSLKFKSRLIAYERGLNLHDFLFNYGVRINPDLLMDLQCDFLPFIVGGDDNNPQTEFLKWNYYPLFESRGNHIINENIGLVAGRFVNSIDTIETPGVQKTFLLQSSSNSRTIGSPALISPNENRNAPEDVLFQNNGVPAGVLLEGEFVSFFKGRLGSVQRDSLARYGGFKTQGESKMIVLADGDLFLNDMTVDGPIPMGMNSFTLGSRYQYEFANRDFLLNCLEYLTSKTSIIKTRNKEIVLRHLDVRKVEAEKTQWRFVNIALPILLVILFGWVYQQVRRYRFAK